MCLGNTAKLRLFANRFFHQTLCPYFQNTEIPLFFISSTSIPSQLIFNWKFCMFIWEKKTILVNQNVAFLSQFFTWISISSGWATIRPKRRFVPSDDSSQATIRPKRQFVPNTKKRQFVPSVNSSHFEKATIRPICKMRQFIPNCLLNQLINNLLKIEINELNE